MKYKKILCPFEFDDRSATALSMAGTLAREYSATLYILHITRVPNADKDVPLPLEEHPRWEAEAREQLARIVQKTLRKNVKYQLEVRTGVPDIDIVRVAKELSVDLIVMRTHTRGTLEQLLMGSVAKQVIHDATCPVLVLHHGDTAEESSPE